MGHASGRIGVIAGALSLDLLFHGAAAMPSQPVLARPNDLSRVMLVCNADGCRHRFKSYRARPEWNGYWSREHAMGGTVPAAEAESLEVKTEGPRTGASHRR